MEYKIGDRLRFKNTSYVFTIEEIVDDGSSEPWVWGSDLPEPYFRNHGTGELLKNWHNPSDRYMELVFCVKPRRMIKKHNMM
tara:strand:+ start:119 stop:364 length:246 start_codon:yes stop_codon:yes gene_type:complete